MKEKVFYLRTGENYTLLPSVSKSLIHIPSREHYYFPERGVEISGMTGLLRGSVDLEDIEEGEKITFTADLTKEALSKPSSYWEVRKFEKLPPNATLLEFEKEKIDKVMNAHQESEKANEEFGKEFQEFMKKTGKILEEYRLKVNPFDYQDKFFKVCEEVFVNSRKT